MKLAFVLEGSLDRKTGGTIYDALVIDGLRSRDVEVAVQTPIPGDAQKLVRDLARSRPNVIVGDELSFAALDIVFEHATFAKRVLLVHHLTCWEEERTPSERARARRLESRVLRRADLAIATSATTRARLMSEGCRAPIPEGRIRRIQ